METVKTILWYDVFYKSRSPTFAEDIQRELKKRLDIHKYPINFDLRKNPQLRRLVTDHIGNGFDSSHWVNWGRG